MAEIATTVIVFAIDVNELNFLDEGQRFSDCIFLRKKHAAYRKKN
jgi:hypothetical protein